MPRCAAGYADMLTILTDRLRLRPLALTDADAIQPLAGDPRVAAWTASFTSPFSREQSMAWVRRAIDAMRAGNAVTLAIALRATGELAGVVSLRLPANEVPHLGYWLGSAYQGKGYCTIRYGFQELGLSQINARCSDDNASSANVMLRCGMRRQPDPAVTEEINGRYVRLVTYVVTRDAAPPYITQATR